MTLQCDYHVLAHLDGRYQTAAASPGVGADEQRELERLFFGQSNDATYLDSLAHNPGIIWRPLRTRYGLTRVLQGQNDANGRATLRFETLLVPQEHAPRVCATLDTVVRDEWKLGATRAEVPIRTRMGGGGEPTAAVALARAYDGRKRLLRPAKELGLDGATAAIRLLHQHPQFSLAYRCLNERAPVMVNLAERTAQSTAVSAAAPTPPGGGRRPYARPARVGAAMIGVLLLQIVTLVLVGLNLARPSGGATVDELGDVFQEPVVNRLVSLQEAVTQLQAELKDVRTAIDERHNEIQGKLAELGTHWQTADQELTRRLDDLQVKVGEVSELSSATKDVLANHVDDLRTLLSPMQARLDELHEQLGAVTELLKQMGKAADPPPEND